MLILAVLLLLAVPAHAQPAPKQTPLPPPITCAQQDTCPAMRTEGEGLRMRRNHEAGYLRFLARQKAQAR